MSVQPLTEFIEQMYNARNLPDSSRQEATGNEEAASLRGEALFSVRFFY